jgi:hypothetical protein
MPVISFGENRDQIWGGAGWAFRQALKDLGPYAQDNDAFLAALEEARHIGYLGVETFDSALRRAVVAAIEKMCLGIISGIRPSSIGELLPGDRVAQARYHEAIKTLLTMARAAEVGSTGGIRPATE